MSEVNNLWYLSKKIRCGYQSRLKKKTTGANICTTRVYTETRKWQTKKMVQQLNRFKANKLTWQWPYEFIPHIAQPICSASCIPYTGVAWLLESLCVGRWWGKVYMLLRSGRWSSKSVKQVNTAHLLQEHRSFNSHCISRSLLLMCWVLCDSGNLVRKVI